MGAERGRRGGVREGKEKEKGARLQKAKPSELLVSSTICLRREQWPLGTGENVPNCLSGSVNSGNECSCSLCQGQINSDGAVVKVRGWGWLLAHTVAWLVISHLLSQRLALFCVCV